MKTKRWPLLAVLALMILVGWGIYRSWAQLTPLPWVQAMPFDGLSEVSAETPQDSGGKGSILLIGDSKLSLTKMTADGEIVFKRKTENKAGEGLIHYDGVTADRSGNVYALQTLLDSNGLYVVGERIHKYSPTGELLSTVAEYRYESTLLPRMMRVGKVKALMTQGDTLYFYYADGATMTLYRAAADGTPSQKTRESKLPSDRLLADVVGMEGDRVFISTKQGEIYQLLASDEMKLIYPLPGVARSDRNVPLSLQVDARGRLVFIDQLLNEISRIDIGSPYIVESLLSAKSFQASGYGELSSLKHIYGSPEGSLYVVTESQYMQLLPDGTIVNQLTSDKFPATARMTRYGAWLLVLAELLLLLLLMRLFYTGLLQRRVPLMLKFLLAFVPIVVVSMIILSNLVYNDLSTKLEDEIRQNLALLASNGKNAVSGDLLERLTTPKHYMNEDYNRIRQSLSSLYSKDKGAPRDGLYTTIYREENGELSIIMDDDDSVTMFRPYPIDDDNKQVLEQGRIITGKVEDSSGSWLYAIGPIYNSANKVVGIYETGKDFNAVKQHNQQVMVKILWYMIGITFIILIVFLAIALSVSIAVRRMRGSVNEISGGKWDASVDIRTRDELADLGERFNAMVAHIRNYIAQITRFSEAYYRFVPQQFLNFIGKESIVHVQLGDQVQRDMTILVSNMRNFYRFSRKLTPTENFHFINSFLKRFGPAIRKYDGFVSRYLGAGILALFPNDADQALRAAVMMRRTLEEYNEHRQSVDYVAIDIGIALHRGPLMLGVIGEEKRLENSVISEHVSLVSQLEQMTEKLGVCILITEELLQGLSNPGGRLYRSLGLVHLQGEEQPLQLYDVYEGDPEQIRRLKKETHELFEAAVSMYQNGRFYDAREAFLEVIRLNRWDQAARLYFYLCDEFFQNGAPTEWNGTLNVS
ncbi:adenylate/guanylate cyclase domain-containing protein [Paenibacillus sp. GD4]|uniref:adenylate/guanylate cyclase domain-containing protein n=1 Tax=Paenibacillus sp. GD4 TaxID=3068890 RepID=UPI0027967000|nr:adenylate/guanylate cyclase domain-containing protein [Paenibacillus sp. GD4]MDQ1909548.1 adenylate/guanylate cyclase domain-containing protein [Paenibacillus sp. GD4]